MVAEEKAPTDTADETLTSPEAEDLDAFLAEHPWPEELADRGEPLHWLWSFELGASPDALWPLVSDTSRLNRSMGLNKMIVEEREGVVHGVATHGGKLHEWTEPPWEWEAARTLAVVRKYTRGWAHYVRSMYILTPLPGERTRMQVYFGWVPRGFLGKIVLKLGMAAMRERYRRALERVVGQARHKAEPFRPPAPELSSEAYARIEVIAGELRENGVDDDIITHIVELVRSGDDLELDQIQPRRLARDWELSERDVLVGFLHATRLGLFDLAWEVVCPLCRGARESAGALSEIPAGGRCEVCNVEFSTEDEHAIEVSFRVHPSIRAIPRLFYCTAEPAKRLHIRLQKRIAAGGEIEAQPVLPPGRYRMRLLEDGAISRYLNVAEGGGGALELSCALADDAECGANPRLKLRNRRDRDVHFIVEGLSWSDDALQPHQLFLLQDFRDLFSDEYIGDDIRLSVGVQTLLFTDVVGSTRFYAEEGDPGAFVRVRAHFKVIHDIVATNHGVVVKTIGDAVMAAFPAALDSLRASEAIHHAFDGSSSPLRVRISVNTGPCIAVNWNSAIDFFGATVNLAAKLQGCAETAQVAMSESVYRAPGVDEFLRERKAPLTELQFEVKALGETIPVWRWDVD